MGRDIFEKLQVKAVQLTWQPTAISQSVENPLSQFIRPGTLHALPNEGVNITLGSLPLARHHRPQPGHGAGLGPARVIDFRVGIEAIGPVEGPGQVVVETNTKIEAKRPRFLNELLLQLLGNDLVRCIVTKKGPAAASGKNRLHPVEHCCSLFGPCIKGHDDPAGANHTFEARYAKNELLNPFDVVAEVHNTPLIWSICCKTAPCFQSTR